jgi:hypothetical protein
MVDNTIYITEAGHKPQQMNGYLNVKAVEKKLQFRELKCHTMIIHKSKKNNSFSDIKVDVWKQSHEKEMNFKKQLKVKTQ